MKIDRKNQLMISAAKENSDFSLVAIAPSIQNYNLLMSGIESDAKIIINEEGNEIEQITTALTRYSPSTLHIICHSSPGVLQLGKTTLSVDNINQYHHLLAEWGVHNILLWSCEVAAKNIDFLKKLHKITHANIAASAYLVGNYQNYSNWQLEYHIGNINKYSLFTPTILEKYSGLFAEPNNSFVTAEDIGTLGATQTFNGFVGTSDHDDYYEFTLNQTSQVNLSLTDLQAAAQLTIVADLDNDGMLDYDETLDETYSGSSADRSLTEILVPGTYAIRVYTSEYSDDSTNYTLTASASAQFSANKTDPGNSL